MHFFCTMRVFDIQASSSSPRLATSVLNFVSFTTSIAELKITYSLTHPAYLMPRDPKHLHFRISCSRTFTMHTCTSVNMMPAEPNGGEGTKANVPLV